MASIDEATPMDDGLDGSALGALARAAEIIEASRYVVVMTGAGMSVESGIPPFRGTDGLWTKFGQPSMDGFRQFKADPQAYWQRQVNAQIDEHILELREALRDASPHAGHFALADLVRQGCVKTVITQNIDGLDVKAGIGDQLIEIHGNRSRLRCIGCSRRTDLDDFVPLFIPDPCEYCGSPVKFDAVMFGEPIVAEVMQAAKDEIDLADCVVAIGTSATVRPASGLLWIAKHRDKGQTASSLPNACLIEINPNPTKLSSICDLTVRARAGVALTMLRELLIGQRANRRSTQMSVTLSD